MKKVLLGTLLSALLLGVPVPAISGVNVGVHVSLPPLIVFHAPPEVVVIPDANDVYVVPDIEVDLFFWNGWWWRPWEGRWYRSYYYDRGWVYYSHVPRFYFDVDPGWRRHYRDHHWYGHPWNYERIPHHRLHENWKTWHHNRHWERERKWDVQNYQPRPPKQRQEVRYQRQQEYQQRPEVRQHQQLRQEQKGRTRVQQPQRREQGHQVQQPQKVERKHEVHQLQKGEPRPQAQQPKESRAKDSRPSKSMKEAR